MNEEPEIAVLQPVEVDLTPGRKYFFCTCGRSKKQPFCDGSHAGTSFQPHMFEATEENKKCWLCMCKRTGGRPYCDGTHNGLAGT